MLDQVIVEHTRNQLVNIARLQGKSTRRESRIGKSKEDDGIESFGVVVRGWIILIFIHYRDMRLSYSN